MKLVHCKKSIDHWIQLYIQAKTDGNTKLMKLYKDLVIKLGGTIPKL